MAYTFVWSPASRDDLRDIIAFISRDSRERAQAFCYRLIAGTDTLQDFPEKGRIVPEYSVPAVREIIVRSYRIIYRLHHNKKQLKSHGYGTQQEEYLTYKVVS